MQEFLNFILQKIASHPEEVKIERTQDTETGIVRFTIQAHPDDLGFIIGKRGKIIRSIRNLLNVLALPQGLRVHLNVKGPEEAEGTEGTEGPEGTEGTEDSEGMETETKDD